MLRLCLALLLAAPAFAGQADPSAAGSPPTSVPTSALIPAPVAARPASAADAIARFTPEQQENLLLLDLSTGGRVVVLLRPDVAPHHVERIKTLVARGFYDNLTFHRVIDGFMAQGGDPRGTGEGGSDLPDLKAEFNDLPHMRGTMSMARANSEDSANSQFFIMLQPMLRLDRHYTVVGRVVWGMPFVDTIARGEPPADPTRILQASMAPAHRAEPAYPAVPAAQPDPVAAEAAKLLQAAGAGD